MPAQTPVASPTPQSSPTPQPSPTPDTQAELATAALGELRNEVQNPVAPDTPAPNSYASQAELNIARVIEKLVLLGPAANDAVGKETATASGDFRKVLDMVLVRLGDTSGIDRVAGYLAETESPMIRFCAVSTLRLARDKGAVPALETALGDPYRRKDGSTPPTTADGMVYPVRMVAAEALIEMGKEAKDVLPRARGEEPK